MSIRHLEQLFRPRSVALIGASRKPRSVGEVVARNLFNGGFAGPVMPVNPHEASIQAALAYPSVAALPLVPDLAVISTPPQTVPGLIAELGARGTKAAIVLSAGFGEGGAEGRALQQQMLDAAKPHLLRVLGPNCLGIMVPAIGLNATFAHVPAKSGDLAFVGQSGAVVTSVLDWAHARGIGFSHLVSLGNIADVDIGDVLDYLAADGGTRAILLYVEAVTHARKFMSAARAAARAKPVVVIKAGRSAAGARAASSHTGALAGTDAVYDAAFRRAGMLRVFALDEIFDAVETLASGLAPRGDRLAIVSNGGGLGVLATDRLEAEKGRLAELSPGTLARLDAALPRTWSRGNPVDIIGDAGPDRYAAAVRAVLDEPNVDGILVINCPTAIADGTEAARAVIDSLAGRHAPAVTSWVGESTAAEPRHLFEAARVPTFATPEQAVRAFMHLVRYRRNQEMLIQVPPSVPELFAVDQAAARAVIASVLAQKRPWLTEPEAKAVLNAYGVRVVETIAVATADEAVAAAAAIGRPVALKILSPDITHKTDVGGVELNLASAERVRACAERMLERVRAERPDARIEGFTVQEMAPVREAVELIVGVAEDPLFGPVILFGHGGVAVEVIGDKALGLPPLNLHLAREMMSRTRVVALLGSYRGHPPADLDAIAATLVKVAQLVIDFSEVAELDINPLLALPDGVLALDARIRVAEPALQGTRRLAIRPYPKRLEKEAHLADGRSLLLRPIRPEDEPLIQDTLSKSTPEDLRLRFFAPLKRLSPLLAARLTQIDYDREMAFVAEHEGAILGVVRISADPDNIEAEYAVFVRSDMKGKGLGYLLMQEMIAYARARGIRAVTGKVLRENTTMLRMADELGFCRRRDSEDPGIVEVRIELHPAG
jgi:acetyltransferase